MDTLAALGYITYWGSIGAVVFSVLVVLLFRTGLVYSARDSEGKLKRDMPLLGYFSMSLVIFGVLGIQVFGLIASGIQLVGFFSVFALNYGLYMFLLLYDTLVIDILVLCLWKPGFLNVPEGKGFTSIRHHLWTLIPGSVIGCVLTIISTYAIVYLF